MFQQISQVAESSASDVKHQILKPSFSLLFRTFHSFVYFGLKLNLIFHIYSPVELVVEL